MFILCVLTYGGWGKVSGNLNSMTSDELQKQMDWQENKWTNFIRDKRYENSNEENSKKESKADGASF